MLDKLDAALRFGQEALNLRAQRQEILAANIANADTPGYQARDIDFASQLNKVLEQGRVNGNGMSLNLTAARHIPAQTLQPPQLDLLYRVPDQPSMDGNTVDMDRERTNFADNSLKYQTDLTLLNGQIKGMMSVRMSLLNIFDISGSALSAQSQRMNVSASNMANADSVTGPDGEPYRAKQVVFQVAAAPGQPTGGVRVAQVVDDPAPERLVYQPGNPLADAKGYVRMPNVDVVGEMVNTISASRSYQANVEVLNTTKSMMMKTLTLGQ